MPNITIDSSNYNIDKYAETCPHCHHAIHPKYIGATTNGDYNTFDILLDIAFQCTSHKCSRLFISSYQRSPAIAGILINLFKFQKSAPLSFKPLEIQQEIKDISPSFEIIFSQSSVAEISNLDEIAGVGYRKSLEFLIKDYCIHKNPADAEKIKNTFLGVVIDNYVTDVNLKACAKRAAWLGNDETHYVKKWENRDIHDLKILIKLTCGWIVNNILTEKYMTEMF